MKFRSRVPGHSTCFKSILMTINMYGYTIQVLALTIIISKSTAQNEIIHQGLQV